MWRVAAVSCSTCVCLLSCRDCAGIVQVGVCSKVIPFTNSDYGVGDFDTSWGWCIYRAQRFHGDGGRNVSLLLACLWLLLGHFLCDITLHAPLTSLSPALIRCTDALLCYGMVHGVSGALEAVWPSLACG
jgi:hypothetical protein